MDRSGDSRFVSEAVADIDDIDEISDLDLSRLLDKPRLPISRSRWFDEGDPEEAAISGLSDYPAKNSSGSFSSHVDSLVSSDSDPKSYSGLKDLLSSKKEIDHDLRSLRHETAEELSDRPKNGVIYKEVTANIESIMERLDYLSNKEETFTIDEAIEIADTAVLLKLLRRPEENNIDVAMAGKLTHEGALLILQAEKMLKKGFNLLDQGKSMLQLAKLKPHTS